MADDIMLSLRNCNDSSTMDMLDESDIRTYLGKIEGWQIEDKFLRKIYSFGAFKQSLAFVNTIANIADLVGYYPQISFSKSLVKINIGNGSNFIPCDFILAAKMDAAFDLMSAINR